MDIAEIKSGCVHQRVIAFFGGSFKSPHNGFSERISYGTPFVGIVAISAKAFV